MTEISADALFIVVTENGPHGPLYSSHAEAVAAAGQICGSALALGFVLAWWSAANMACFALEASQEPCDAADKAQARSTILDQRMDAWRRYLGTEVETEVGVTLEVPEPMPASGSPTGEALSRAIEEYLATMQNNIVASQVRAVEVATLRGVTREKVNVASQLKALARLVAAAASQAPQPNVVISAFATLCVHELVAIALHQKRAGVVGHA